MLQAYFLPGAFHFVSDEEGHYDIDGVSYGCNQVFVASDKADPSCPCWMSHSYQSIRYHMAA